MLRAKENIRYTAYITNNLLATYMTLLGRLLRKDFLRYEGILL